MHSINTCRFLLILALVCAGLVVASCEHGKPSAPKAEAEPLLLLDEPLDDGAESSGPVADNSRCYVCHMNFEVDDFAVTHASADVGCEECHGASYAHADDEDNITPPDTMFAKEDVNAFCLECHEENGLEPNAHLAVLTGTATAEEKYCTQCHGEHRLSHRTRLWNKKTGELIKDDNVRMLRE